jgi:two-component system OmpR family response regulator
MDGTGDPARGVLPPRTAPIRFATFTFDLDGCSLLREDGAEIALTRNELALLREFVRHPGRVLSRDYLLDALAGKRADPYDRSVDVLVGRLRRKIEPDAKQPTLIVTVAGEGYKFATPVGGAAAFDWDRIPDDKLRVVEETLRLAQRDGIVIDHE